MEAAVAAVLLSILEQSQLSAPEYTTTQFLLCMEAAVVSSSRGARSQSRPLRSTGTQ
jgi:hypothetical protein